MIKISMDFEKRTPINSIWNKIKNATIHSNKYRNHSEGVIVACYFNPQNSPYRTKAFSTFYESIKHLNHRIVECVIGEGKPEFQGEHISHVYTKNLLWHKESLLNKVISELPKKYKYVFWIDADVIFTNNNWFVEGVEALGSKCKIIQPFEYCIHLDQDQTKPTFNLRVEKEFALSKWRHPKIWKSFCANHSINGYLASGDENYDMHGHVGFSWGARREILDTMPLYDRALIGGADHIIAHAAAGHIKHRCIQKSFTENMDEVNEWSRKFYKLINGKIGYVKGDLFHIWHGDIEKRQYLKRVQEFTPKTREIVEKDENGLYVHSDNEAKEYMEKYFSHREVSDKKVEPRRKLTPKEKIIIKNKKSELISQYPGEDESFLNSMLIAYLTDSTLMGAAFGGNITGAIIGDMMNNSDDPVEFGGGDFGGSGAGDTWDVIPEDNSNHNNSDVVSDSLVFTVSNDTENFS
jgi:hypothetical protein